MADQKFSRSQLRGINVILVVLSGIAINQLSDLLDLQSSVIIVGSLLVVVAMLSYEHFSTSDREGALAEVSIQVKWCLASLLLGAIIGGCARLPIIPDRIYHGRGPFDGTISMGMSSAQRS
jgi:hypothetical protein